MSELVEDEPAADLEQVCREIDAEVRRLRGQGAFPPSFERRLEDLFALVVPPGVSEHEAVEALRNLESLAHVSVEVPVASRLPAGRLVKAVLRRLMGWYMEYLANQLNNFLAATVRVARLLDERVLALEAEVPYHRALPLPAGRSGEEAAAWAGVLLEHLAITGPRGPVLHVECGRGELLRALIAGGVDAYGVDHRADLLDEAVLASAETPTGPDGAVPAGHDARNGPDARWAGALDHLRSLEDASLGGLVLSGCVDRFEVGAQRELAALAATKVAEGGLVGVIGTSPAAWLSRRTGGGGEASDLAALLEADLAPGRPLYPQTWVWLLGSEGLSQVEIHQGPPHGLPAAANGTFLALATRPSARRMGLD